MQDVQSSPAEVSIPIDRVGIRSIRLPLTVKDRDMGSQHTVARVDMAVDLPASFKGTHMSRFVEALETWPGELNYHGFKELVVQVRDRLEAQNAHVLVRFPYFVRRLSPASGAASRMDYACTLEGDLIDPPAPPAGAPGRHPPAGGPRPAPGSPEHPQGYPGDKPRGHAHPVALRVPRQHPRA